ncbi:MAG: hypothetical protein AOA65_0231 [Candidatus Bathyarchaeota archaeon BA1]|nr:MAG: hypothetical protein AOA65_0231 [Candidatus Bathyarchaeota archaeon BA1]
MIKRHLKIYVENSVISAYHFAPRLIVVATRRLFENAVREKHKLFTSDVTIAELEKADREVREKALKVIETFDVKVVSMTVEARDLANEYVKRGVIPAMYRPDAEHIAVASVLGFDVLTSWNLAHIVKLKTKRMVRIINEELGYPVPEIVRPDEV